MWSVLLTGLHWHDAWDWGHVCVCVCACLRCSPSVGVASLRMLIDGNRLRSRGMLEILKWCCFACFLLSSFFSCLAHHPRWMGVLVLVRVARAFSCVGSGVGDPRLVHAAGGDVGRLPVSVSTCAGLAPVAVSYTHLRAPRD